MDDRCKHVQKRIHNPKKKGTIKAKGKREKCKGIATAKKLTRKIDHYCFSF